MIAVAQALVGLVQSLTGIPGSLVAIHLLGSALVWIGALRVLLDVNPGLFPNLHGSRAAAAVNPVDA